MITERRWKQICYTILVWPVSFYVGIALYNLAGVSLTMTRLVYWAMIPIWLMLIWRPRRAS
jgi:hypothetical protein